MKVFLSYAEADRDVAKELASHLEEAGHRVWDPANARFPGDNWALRIGKALEDCEAMVLLLSPQSAKSEWARQEWEYALGSERYKGRLIPVEVKPTKDAPWILKRLPVVHLGEDIAEVAKEIEAYLEHGFELHPSKS